MEAFIGTLLTVALVLGVGVMFVALLLMIKLLFTKF